MYIYIYVYIIYIWYLNVSQISILLLPSDTPKLRRCGGASQRSFCASRTWRSWLWAGASTQTRCGTTGPAIHTRTKMFHGFYHGFYHGETTIMRIQLFNPTNLVMVFNLIDIWMNWRNTCCLMYQQFERTSVFSCDFPMLLGLDNHLICFHGRQMREC